MADEANSGGGNKIKTVIGLAVLMIVIAAATSYFFMNFYASPTKTTVKKEKQQKEGIGTTYSLGDFVVNLSDTGGYQFIKASIVVEVSKDQVVQELDQRNPQIRDIIITVLRDQKMVDIEEPGAKTIKNQIMARLNQILTKGKITSVWFTQLVVQ